MSSKMDKIAYSKEFKPNHDFNHFWDLKVKVFIIETKFVANLHRSSIILQEHKFNTCYQKIKEKLKLHMYLH